MPIYTIKDGRKFEFNSRNKDFENTFPDATVDIVNGDEHYDVPIQHIDRVLNDYPDAWYHVEMPEGKPVEKEEKPGFLQQVGQMGRRLFSTENFGAAMKSFGSHDVANDNPIKPVKTEPSEPETISMGDDATINRVAKELGRNPETISPLDITRSIRNEEKRISQSVTPKPVEKQDDILQNAVDRFEQTAEAQELNAESQEALNKHLAELWEAYKNTDRYKTLVSAKPKNEEEAKQLTEQINEDFSNTYADDIDAFLQPYNQKKQDALMRRYGRGIEKQSREMAIADSEQRIGTLQDEIDDIYKGRRERGYQADSGSLRAASHLLEEADEIVKAAKRKDTNFFEELGHGFWDNLDARNFTLGLSDYADNTNLRIALEAAEKGEELSPDQEKLLEASVVNMALKGYYGKQLGRGYKAGQMTAESLPFMLEFIANPISGSGNAIAKGLLKWGMKRFGASLVNRALPRFAGRLAGDAAAAAGMTATTSLPNVFSGAEERLADNYNVTMGEDGKPQVERVGDTSKLSAYGSSAFSQFIENQSEMVFNAFRGFNPLRNVKAIIPDPVVKLMDKIASSGAGKFIGSVRNNKLMQEIAERAQFHGLPEEYLEEVYNNFANVAAGEMSMEDATNLSNNIDTFLGLAPTSVAFGMIGLGSLAHEKYQNRKNLQRAFGNLTDAQKDKLAELQERAASGTDALGKDIHAFLEYTINDQTLTPEEKRNEIEYLYETYKSAALADADNSRDAEEVTGEENQVQEEADADMEAQAQSAQDNTNAYRELIRAQRAVGIARTPEEKATAQERLQAATDAFRAFQQDYDSQLEAVRQAASSTAQEDISRLGNQEAGSMMSAIMKSDMNNPVSVTGGVIVMNESGQIDKEASSDIIYYFDPREEKVKMASVDDFDSVSSEMPFEDYINSSMQEAEDNFSAQKEAELNTPDIPTPNELQERFAEGDVTATFDINGRPYMIDSVNEDGIQLLAVGPRGELDTKGDAPFITQEEYYQIQEQNLWGEEPSETQPESSAATEAVSQSETAEAGDTMPMNGEGEEAMPDFSKVTPQRAHSYLYQESGLDAADADEFVKAYKKDAEAALRKVQKMQPKPGDKGIDKNIARYNAAKANWQAQVDQAQKDVDYWSQVEQEQAAINKQAKIEQAKLNSERQAEQTRQAIIDEQKRKEEEARKAEEQAAVGSNNVNPAIREKWNAAPKIEGNRNEIALANGEKVPGRYMLVESGAVSASHNSLAGFAKTEGFPINDTGQTVNDRDYERDKSAQDITRSIANNYDQRALQTPVVVTNDGVVLSGNGRTMAGELAAEQGTDQAYIDYLRQYPEQFGFTSEQVGQMQHPRVVFVPDEAMPYTTDTFSKFNQQEMKSQSKTEKAVKLGKTVDDKTFSRIVRSINAFDNLGDFYAKTDVAANAINELQKAGVINQNELSEYFDGDTLSQQGKELLENTLIGKAFENNPDAVRMITAFKSVRQSVITALSEVANNVALGEDYSLQNELADAIALVYAARNSTTGYKAGDRVSDYARQGNLFQLDEGSTVADWNNAAVMMLADILNDSKVSQLRKFMAVYNREAALSAQGQADIFSGTVKNKQEIINFVKNLFNYGTESEQREAVKSATEQRKQSAEQQPAPETESNAQGGIDGQSLEGNTKPGGEVIGYSLSDKKDNEGNSFYQRNGSIDLWNLSSLFKLARRQDAPIRLTDRNMGHILSQHKKEQGNSPERIFDFLDKVFSTAKILRRARGGAMFAVLENENTDQAAIIKLYPSEHGDYYNVETAGYYRNDYWKEKENEVLADLSEPSQSDAATNTSKPQESQNNGENLINAEAQQPSESKDTQSSDKKQENQQENLQQQLEIARQEVDQNPTDAQKEAGNYKKGHLELDGYNITIENPKGSTRSGVDAQGNAWSQTMNNDYGYLRGTESVDGDHIDVFLSDNPEEGNVYVVDQVNPDGSFDEHKVMYGFESEEEARQAYLANYEEGWQGLGKITAVSKDEFKKWIKSSTRKTKPFAEYKSVEPLRKGTYEQYSDEARQIIADILEGVEDNKGPVASAEMTNAIQRIADMQTEAEDSLSASVEDADERLRLEAMRDVAYNWIEENVIGEGAAEEKEEAKKESYQVSPYTYTKKNGDTIDMKLVKFDKLDPDVKKKLNGLARELKGWWSREDEGYLLRSDEAVRKLVDAAEASEAEEKEEPKQEVKPLKEQATVQASDNYGRKYEGMTLPEFLTAAETDYGKGFVKKVNSLLKKGDGNSLYVAFGADGTVFGMADTDEGARYAASINKKADAYQVLPFTQQAEKQKTVKDSPHYSYDIEDDYYERRLSRLREQYKSELPSAEYIEKKIQDISRDIELNEEELKYAKDDLTRSLLLNHVASSNGSLRAFKTFRDEMRKRRTEQERDKALAEHGLKIGDRIMYMGKEATVYDADSRTVTLDTGLAPVLYESTEWGNINPLSKIKTEEEAEVPASEYGSNNTLVTKNRYEELKEKMRKKLLGQMNIGIDPEILAIGIEMAVYHIESGARKFSEYAKAMIADLGDKIRPYLKAFYNGARDLPEVQEAGFELDDTDTVRNFDVTNFDKPSVDILATADDVAKQEEVSDWVERAKPALAHVAALFKGIGLRWDEKKKKYDFYSTIDGSILRQATEEDLENSSDIYYEGQLQHIIARVHQGEQGPQGTFGKPTIEKVLLSNGKWLKPGDGLYVKIADGELKNVKDKGQPSDNKPAKQQSEKPSKGRKEKPVELSLDLFSQFENAENEDNNGGNALNNEGESLTSQKDNNQNNRDNGLQGIHELRTEGLPANGTDGRDNRRELGETSGEEARGTDGAGDQRLLGRSRQGNNDSLRSAEQLTTSSSAEKQGEEELDERPENPQNTNNNRAERGKDYAPKGVDARIEANIKAIELMHQLIESDEKATPDQMKVLRQFSGWGGLGKAFDNEAAQYKGKSIPQYLKDLLGEAYQQAVMSRNSAYYTPAGIIDTLWDIARAMGFKGGNMLEGSAGIGNIIGLMPQDMSERSNIHAVEIDQTTGALLSLLYPDARVDIQGFESTQVENGSIDLAITNVPFVTGLRVNDTSGDKDLSRKFHDIHDFCIAKNIRKLKEGGIGIFITSSGTLDNSARLREWIDQEGGADVVGAFRLNNETFGGTGATSDIIVVRKRVNGKKSPYAIDVLPVSGERTAEYTTGEIKRVKGVETPVVKQLSMDYNSYFIEHPEMMGGEMHFGFEKGDTFRPTSKALYPTNGKNQEEMLRNWAKSFSEKDWKSGDNMSVGDFMKWMNDQVYDNLGEGVKEGSMLIDSKGSLCIAQRGRGVPLNLNANKVKGHTKEECFYAYKAMKDALSDVLNYQTNNEDEAGLKPLLKSLNDAYDGFVKTYGHLHKNTSISFLKNDVDFANIIALEKYSEKGDKKTGKRVQSFAKTDVFSKRVIEKEKNPEPKNVKDGIISSIFVHGRVDLPWITEKLNEHVEDEAAKFTEEGIKADIIKQGLGYENPVTRQVEVSYEYLSGNVREKLLQAINNNSNGQYEANIKALENVIPANIPAHLIDFTLGSSWVEPNLYEEYVEEKTNVKVKFTAVGGTWFMKTPSSVNEQKNRAMGVVSEMFKRTIPGTKLIEAAIQNKTITVSETKKRYDGSTETVTDKEATQACANKIDEIRQDFKDWAKAKLQSDSELAKHIEQVYNDMFNNYVPKSIPDEFVPKYFAGASRSITLDPHQSHAAMRAVTEPLMLAHEVGAGKTFTLITTAMEMRRLGTARKPMIVVQNSTVGQFVESAKELYPNAKVLTIEEADRTVDGRKNFYAKIKYNDWDMIVVPQSVFERIPDSEERQMRFVKDKIEEKLMVLEQMRNEDPSGQSMIVRQAEQEMAKLEDELASLTESINSKRDKRKERDEKKTAIAAQNAEVRALEMLDRQTDDVENFDDMGIDAVLVDEAHEYKHLGFATAMQRGVKGIDPSYSKKAQGVFLKTQAVLEKNNGRNVVFATGTPISNTAAEIWTFMRYLMPADTMKDYGIYYFDDFVRNFGNLSQMLEFTTSGKFKENNRFAGYVNLPELVRIWSGVSDTVTQKEIEEYRKKVGKPTKIPATEQKTDSGENKAEDIYLPQTKALRSIMKYVKKKLDDFEKMNGKQKKENSHIPLTMYGIAKAAAVDARLVMADAADEQQSKTNEAVRQTLRALKDSKSYKGTVALFADNYQNRESGFNLYEDIREKLIRAGVPEEQIVVMRSGMSVKKKLEIFDKVNAGEIRVIMGSTFTLGTGVNIQERLFTLIHLDAPNRPMDYTQRNGRILRQGNMHKEMDKPVRVLRFGVEDSLDVTAYQRLKTKGAIADSIMNGKKLMENSMENRSMDEEEDVFGDTVAQLSGSEYAMLKNQAEKDVRKYEAKKKQYEADQIYCNHEIPKLEKEIEYRKKTLDEFSKALDIVKNLPEEKPIKVGDFTFGSVDEMGDFIKEFNKSIKEAEDKLRANPGLGEQTRTLAINIAGIDFEIKATVSYELASGGSGSLFPVTHRDVTYSCPTLFIKDSPVYRMLLREGLEEIVTKVLRPELYEKYINWSKDALSREENELKQIRERFGKPFEYSKELDTAHERFNEYSLLMKKEMEEKEMKYAQMDSEVDEATDIANAEEAEEEEGNELFRDGNDEEYRATNEELLYRIREEKAPQKTGIGYKVFVLKDGQLYPPMVANPNGEATPVGVWLDADAAPVAGQTKTGRNQVKAGGKGTQGGSGRLSYRPGWHLGNIPYAIQFNRTDPETGKMELFPKDFVWAEVEYAADKDYQDEAMQQGVNKNGNFQHSLAGLQKVPTDGFYTYRTNPNPETDPWIITGAMKVKRLLTPSEVDELVRKAGREPQKRQEGFVTDNEIRELNKQLAEESRLNRQGDIASRWWRGHRNEETAKAEQERIISHLKELAELLNLDNVDVALDPSVYKERKAKAKGWFNTKTGKITIMVPNNISTYDAEKTLLHEAVAHYGLRRLLGERFDDFLYNIFKSADAKAKNEITYLMRGNGWDLFTATEEYLASLAENANFERIQPSLWQKIKMAFMDLLTRLGFRGFSLMSISDNDMRYLLWRSYENLKYGNRTPIRHSMIDLATDIAKRYELGVGDYEKEPAPRYYPTGNAVVDAFVQENKGAGQTIVLDEDGDMVEQLVEAGMVRSMAEKTVSSHEVASYIPKFDRVIITPNVGEKELISYLWHENVHRAILKMFGENDGNKVVTAYRRLVGLDDYTRKLDDIVKEEYADKDGYWQKEEFLAYYLGGLGMNGTIGEEVNRLASSVNDNTLNVLRDIYNYIKYGTEEKEPAGRVPEGNNRDAGETGQRRPQALRVRKGFGNGGRISQRKDVGELFRDGGMDDAQREYEKAVRTKLYKMQEAWQDSMLGLKELMKAVEKQTGQIKDYENPYFYENAMSSRNLAEMEAYRKTFFADMLDAVDKLEKDGVSKDEIEIYMVAKHGLERNEYMAKRDAQKKSDSWLNGAMSELDNQLHNGNITQQDYNNRKAAYEKQAQKIYADEYSKNRERDYAGLTALADVDPKEIVQAEQNAKDLIADFERLHDVTDLWEKVNAATKAQIDMMLEGGLIDKDTFNRINGMYEYYIPLRGWEETTAMDVYQYMDDPNRGINSPLKTAKGRTSLADSPLATIGNMAESAIMQKNRNHLKQMFMTMAMNHRTNLVTVSPLWAQFNHITQEWEPAVPQIPDNATPQQVEEITAQFEEQMRQLEAQMPNSVKKITDKAKIPYKITNDLLKQHQILVKRNGIPYVLTVNGSPRAAQAINGLTNPDVEKHGFISGSKKVLRYMAALNTAWNPEFIISNLLRDGNYTNSMVEAKEGKDYALRYHKNWAVALKGMAGLVSRFKSGTLDLNNPMDAAFHDFIMNGGETGYTHLNNVEDYKGIIAKELKDRNTGKLSFRNAVNVAAGALDTFGRWAEDTSRFAAFLTSRQMGRSMVRSIWDAKEISVNFNKKGSGNKFAGSFEKGNKWNYVQAGTADYGRAFIMFLNAGVQGLANYAKIVVNHPGKAAAILGAHFAAGALNPIMNELLISMFWGDPDDYYNLPEFTRTQNLCIYIGDGKFLAIPLAIELRVLYGLGNLATETIEGKNNYGPGKLAVKVGEQLSGLLPVDVLGEGMRSFLPAIIAPMYDVARNKDWTGKPIYKEDSFFNKNAPGWTKAYKGNSPVFIELSRWINNWTGGSDYSNGWLMDAAGNFGNPGVIEYLMESYSGGLGTTINKMAKTLSLPFSEDLQEDWLRNIPVGNRFVKEGSDIAERRRVDNEYYDFRDDMDKIRLDENGYRKDGRKEELQELRNSDKYRRYQQWKELQKRLEKLNERYKQSGDEDVREVIYDLKRTMNAIARGDKDNGK